MDQRTSRTPKIFVAIERTARARSPLADLEVMRSDGRRHLTFAGGSIEAEGYGTTVAVPSWGPKPR